MHCVAVGDEKEIKSFLGDVKVSTSFTAVGKTETLPGNSTIDVRVERIDDMIPKAMPILLFKTDTQGFELDVLRGAKELLSQGNVLFLMIEFSYGLLHRAGTQPSDLLDFVYDLGYVCTYMAYHTRMLSNEADTYRVVEYRPYKEDGTNSISFPDFVDSLRVVNTRGSAKTSGWTDLLCWKPWTM